MVMRSWTRWGAALAASVALTAVCGAAQAQNAAGDWHGTLTAPTGAMLRLGLTLKAKAGGGYEGVLTSVDQGGVMIPLDQAKVEKGTLSFSIAAIRGSYSGSWDKGRKAWVGQWTQGAALPLVLTAGKP
jgi:hypothetical protein